MTDFKAPQRVWRSTLPIARPIGVHTLGMGLPMALFLPSLANVTFRHNAIELEFLIIINVLSLMWFLTSYPIYYIWPNWRVVLGTSLIIVGSSVIGFLSLYVLFPFLSGLIIWFTYYVLISDQFYDDLQFTDRPDSKFLGLNNFGKFWH